MKKILVSLAAFTMGATAFAAAIEQVIVRQQWPWSTDVKVEYKLSGVTAPVNLTVKAYNGLTELPLPAEAVKGDRYGVSEDGVGQLTIDPVAAFGTEKIALANFKVKLEVVPSPEGIHDPLYKIFDLVNGGVRNVSRADIMNDHSYGAYETNYAGVHPGFSTNLRDPFIWTGVTNSLAYKTTHLVMRRIPGKDAQFQFGAANSNCKVNLTNDYYVGVFKVTNEQWKNIFGSYNGSFIDKSLYPNMEVLPALGIRWDYYVGFSGNCDWSGVPTIPATSDPFALYQLMKKFSGYSFHFPSEAQWEFAARAGTADAFHGATAVGLVAFANDPGVSVPAPVGMFLPNAFGLYDVIGNGNEWCRDWRDSDKLDVDTQREITEPEGSSQAASTAQYPSAGHRVCRGNKQSDKTGWLTVFGRSGVKPNGVESTVGARLWCVEK